MYKGFTVKNHGVCVARSNVRVLKRRGRNAIRKSNPSRMKTPHLLHSVVDGLGFLQRSFAEHADKFVPIGGAFLLVSPLSSADIISSM